MTYARYTEYRYDPADGDALRAFWSDPSTGNGSDQPGFLGSYVLDSVEVPGLLRLVSLWKDQASFDAYYASELHDGILASLDGLGAERTVRDGLVAAREVVPAVGHVRLIRFTLNDGVEPQDYIDFWQREGHDFFASTEGVLKTESYVWPEERLLVLQIWYRDQEHADRFVASERHDEFAARTLRRLGTRLERNDLTPVPSKRVAVSAV